MKKFVLVAFCVVLLVPALLANNGLNVRVGFLSPSASKTSFFPGISYGINIDNVVELATGFDYFYNNSKETEKIGQYDSDSGNLIDTIEMGSDITTIYVPIMGTLKVGIPLDAPVIPYAGIGLGWGILWEDVFIAADPDGDFDGIDKVSFYHGFNWATQIGVKYPLAPRASVYGEAFYNGGKMKSDIKKDAYSITWDEINMSGMGLRLGIELRM
jgi:outer membrane protein W